MPSRARRVFRFVLAAVLVLVVAWGASVLAVVYWGWRDTAQPADAIVVLGAAQYDGRPSPVLRARLDHALRLWRRGMAPRVFLTGGSGVRDTTSEAAVGRRYMLRHGVPDSAMVLESEGRTTRQSLTTVAAYMHQRKLRTAILVSDPFHMLRLAIVAGALGLTAFTSPTHTSPISASPARLGYVLSESVKAPLTWLMLKAGM